MTSDEQRSAATVALSVLTPYSVEIKCPCGLRPGCGINVMSLSERAETTCECGRSFVVRSGLGGVTAKEAI